MQTQNRKTEKERNESNYVREESNKWRNCIVADIPPAVLRDSENVSRDVTVTYILGCCKVSNRLHDRLPCRAQRAECFDSRTDLSCHVTFL